MKISIMWMTRNRSYELVYSLCSFIMKAKDNSNIEYIVISDPDDSDTIDALEKIKPINEKWKGSTAFVGINRKWYEVTNRVSGNRATDGYISDLGKELGLEPLRPIVEMLHLQRGKGEINFNWDGKDYVTKGLDDDGLGGYPTRNPKPPKYYHNPNEFTNDYTNFKEGKKRFDKDLKKLRGYYE